MNIVERLKDSLEYEYNLSFSERKQLLEEINRLNNIIKKLIYECWGSDMSYEEFGGVWQIAFDEKYEPDKIKKIEEELKENNKDAC